MSRPTYLSRYLHFDFDKSAYLFLPRCISYSLTVLFSIITVAATAYAIPSSAHHLKLYGQAISIPAFPSLADVDISYPITKPSLIFHLLFSLILGLAALLALGLMLQPREEYQKELRGEVTWTLDRFRTQAAICGVVAWAHALVATASVTRVGLTGWVEIVQHGWERASEEELQTIHEALEAATGFSARYWDHAYVKVLVVSSWGLLSTSFISMVLLVAAMFLHNRAEYHRLGLDSHTRMLLHAMPSQGSP